MKKSEKERISRRLIILEGVTVGLSNEEIAHKLGVLPVVVSRDLRRMKRCRDLELKQAQSDSFEKSKAEKDEKRNRSNERFLRITGMTFQEKTFSNMMSFYEPEIRKIMRASKQDVAIRGLPNSVVKTLKRNGIIAPGYKTPQVTQKARNYLAKSRLLKFQKW